MTATIGERIARRARWWQQAPMRTIHMQTGWAIVLAAVILAAAGAATAMSLEPRYSVSNPGNGVTVRLDRRTGDMIGCTGLNCASIYKDGKVVPPIGTAELPAGYVLDVPTNALPPGYRIVEPGPAPTPTTKP